MTNIVCLESRRAELIEKRSTVSFVGGWSIEETEPGRFVLTGLDREFAEAELILFWRALGERLGVVR